MTTDTKNTAASLIAAAAEAARASAQRREQTHVLEDDDEPEDDDGEEGDEDQEDEDDGDDEPGDGEDDEAEPTPAIPASTARVWSIDQPLVSAIHIEKQVGKSSLPKLKDKSIAAARAEMRLGMRSIFSLVIPEGGGAQVAVRPRPGVPVTWWRESDLKVALENRAVSYSAGGKTAPMHPATEWRRDLERRTYVRTEFQPDPDLADPDAYNLWTGFKVQPAAPGVGSWSLMDEHIRQNIIAPNCSTPEEADNLYAWTMTWIASLFQYPGRKFGTAVAMIGEEGTGKSILFKVLGQMIGCASTKITHSKHLTGAFNAALDNKILVVAEEAFWSGDRSAAGIIRDLITDDRLQVEAKGKDSVLKANFVRLAFVSNERWVVPTGDNGDARRFLVLQVGNGRKQDLKFFGDLMDEMNGGGREAMLRDLLAWKPEEHGLRWDDLITAPRTAARDMQAGYGLSPAAAALRAIVEAGELAGRTQDGQPFRYDLHEEEETNVGVTHLMAAIQKGGTSYASDREKAKAAVDTILGERAWGGENKRPVTWMVAERDGMEAEVTRKMRFIAVPPVGALRAALAARFGGA